MKFKALRRPPWRRKKSPPSPSHSGHAALSVEEDLPGPSHRVDPAAYNELVTPRCPELGLGTPDKSHIVFRAPRDHSSRSLHPDTRGHVPCGISKIWRRSYPSGGRDANSHPEQGCITWSGAGRGRDCQGADDHCITFFDEETPEWGKNVGSPRRMSISGGVDTGLKGAGSGGQVPRDAGGPHCPPATAQQHTTCFIDPRDAAWSPVCGACPGEEWAGVGAGGGAGKGARAAAGLTAQCGGDSVTRRVAHLPTSPPASSHRRSRDRAKPKSRKAVSEASAMMRGGPGGRRAGRGSLPVAEGLPQQEAACRSAKILDGTTLPGHAAPTLTHIDYDSRRPPGGKEVLVRPPPPPSPLQKSRPGRRSAASWVEGGRDGGACPGGRRVQGSGTCGALGQPGPRTTVSARASPRAHARRSVTQHSVARSSSSNSSGGRARGGSVGECEAKETWPRDTAAVCEGECVCDMPCKVSGIPVYQGRGSDPPRSPREDGSPTAPLGGVAGHGRGTARRAGATRTSPNSSGISPVQMPRRGSFGAPRATIGSGGEVALPRRASLPGPGAGAPTPGTPESPRESPSLKARGQPPIGRGPSPAPGGRAVSPLPSGKASSTVRRRESQRDTRTPPSTPLARRPPPRAVYQVRLAAAAPAPRDVPPSSRDKPSSKLPVASLKGDASPGSSRTFVSRAAATKASTTSRAGREAEAGEGRSSGQAGASSLKLDTPPRSLPLSLSLKSPKSGRRHAAQDLNPSTGTPSSQFQGGPRGGQRASSTPHLARSWTLQEKAAARVNASPVRVAIPRRSPSDASKHSDSRLDRSLSSSSTQINTRTTTGPKSSLVAGDAANRARIVRRVMAGGRSNLSKKKSSSKTSLTVGRHNLYNRAKSGSRSSLLGSRNNVFRASLDSQRTESTTDSGCNSPLSGSQCSLDGDRRRHGSPPSPVPRAPPTDLTNKTGSALGRLSASLHTPRPPESPAIGGFHLVADTGERIEERVREAPQADVKSLLSAHSLSSSQLVREATKPVVSVKRSFSLQFPCEADAPQTALRPASSSSRLSRPRLDSHEEREESRLQPGISVSIRSLVPNTPPQASEALRSEARRSGVRKEVTKVSIVAEPRTREEKGIQVESPSSEEEEEEEGEEEKVEEEERRGKEEEEERRGKEEEEEAKEKNEQSNSILDAAGDHRYYTEVSPSPGREEEPPGLQGHQPRGGEQQPTTKQSTPTTNGGLHMALESGEEGEEEESGDTHLMQRLETSLADIIDAAVLKNLRINGSILSDQFDAIIATLKKVAASVDSGETTSPPLPKRDSQCGTRGSLRTPSSPLTPPPVPTSPLGSSVPRTPPSKTPLSLFSINECQAGPTSTPPLRPRNRRLSLPKDSLQDVPPDPGPRRFHHDHEEQASDLPSPHSYGRKNSTGSLGLWGRGAPLPRNGALRPPSTTTSVTNLCSAEDYMGPFSAPAPTFRKVHSTTNVSGGVSGGPHRLFQRHFSTPGPDDVSADHRLRKGLSKSRELLTQLEHEYRRIKGDDHRGRDLRATDHSWLEEDFDELLETLSSASSPQNDPRGAFPPVGDRDAALSSASSSKSDKWRTARREAPPRPPTESSVPQRAPGPPGADGRHIFSFFHKKGRSHSLSGTEAIKMALPATPEVEPQATAPPRPAPRTARSNSIPSSAPLGVAAGAGLPLDLVAIFRRGRGGPRRVKARPHPTTPQEDQEDEDEVEEQEGGKQTRSLSLPKSFLSDKYGLSGFKAALPR